MQIRPGIELASLSDVGCQRENNEDRYLYWEPESDEQFEHKGRLAMVADGMGGHEGGQEASRIAAEAVEDVYSHASDGAPQELLLAGFKAAHERIQEHASQHPALHGMGTTATAIALLRDQLYYAHIGDSRLYLVRGEQHLASHPRPLLRGPAGGKRNSELAGSRSASSTAHSHGGSGCGSGSYTRRS